MHLIKGLANRNAASFQFHLNQRQSVDQNRDIVAVGMAAGLFELPDHLQLVASQILFIQQLDVLDAAIVEHKIVDIVIVNLAGFIDAAFARFIEKSLHEAQPLAIGELHVVQRLKLRPHIGEQSLLRVQVGPIFEALVLQIDNEFPFQIPFALVAFRDHPFPSVFFQDDEMI